MTTGAQAIVKVLQARGVRHTFGIPGAQNLELFDAIVDSTVENVLVTSELSAAFMADGYARACGQVGVCIAIPGPGLSNMITGIAEAYLDSSPLVVLVAAVEKSEKAFHLHEIDQIEMLKPVVKRTIRIEKAGDIVSGLSTAFATAQASEPGPVAVELTRDLLREEAGAIATQAEAKRESKSADPDTVRRIAKLLAEANQCGIYAGKGALSASPLVVRLAEILSAPVATTISGKGVIAEDHRLAAGFGFGPSGTPLAEEVFGRCDVVLALGCKFAEMSTSKWQMNIPGKLIHVDTNEAALNRNYPADIALCADAASVVAGVIEHLTDLTEREGGGFAEEMEQARARQMERARSARSKRGVHPARLLAVLRERVSRDTVMVTDCGSHQLWAILDWRVFEPRGFITPSDYQAMGFGVPAAIGACLARPEKRVVCISGDGGFLITGFELLTAVRERLKLAVVIFNDGALGLIKDMQNKFYGRTESVDIASPGYEELARSLGVDYVAIANEDELEPGLIRMAACQGVVLVDVKVDYSEWPDFIDRLVKATFRSLPLGEQLKMLAKRAGRMLKYRR